MSSDPTTRDHRDEHSGCRAQRPWDQGCSRYRLTVNLIAAATADVAGMPEADRADLLDFLRGWEGRGRWHLRSEFISHREKWRESDQRENLANAASMARLLGEEYLLGRTVEQAAAEEWTLKVQRLALEVLYVHKAQIPDYVPGRPF